LSKVKVKVEREVKPSWIKEAVKKVEVQELTEKQSGVVAK
jgi:hypothetical protein